MSYLEKKALYRRNRFKISIKNGMLQVNVEIFALICCDRTMIATCICYILLLIFRIGGFRVVVSRNMMIAMMMMTMMMMLMMTMMMMMMMTMMMMTTNLTL